MFFESLKLTCLHISHIFLVISILDLDRSRVESRRDFPGGSDGKESASGVGDLAGFDPWVGKIPWRRA